VHADAEVGVAERGVGQPVAEGIVDLQLAGIEPAVANVNALTVSDMAHFAGEVKVRRGVLEPYRHGFGQLAGRVDLS
jgi:hypothetical protein